MEHRSPARYLAPLALVGFAVALVLVIGGSTRSDDDEPVAPTATVQRTTDQGNDRDRGDGNGERRRRRAETYTVVAGDTPSGIAEKTGVPLSTIEELNPDLDPQALSVGDEIRIR